MTPTLTSDPLAFVEMDDTGYHARVLNTDNRIFTVGNFDNVFDAWRNCQYHIWDLQRIPHAHARRALTNAELKRMSDEELAARARVVKYRRGYAAVNEWGRIKHAQKERTRTRNCQCRRLYTSKYSETDEETSQ